MVLTSQTPRQTNRWRHTTNERQRRRSWSRMLLLLGAMALILVGLWAIFLRGEGDPADASGSTQASTDGSGSSGVGAPVVGAVGEQGESPRAADGSSPLGGAEQGASSGRSAQGPRDGDVIELGGGTPLPPRSPERSNDASGAAPPPKAPPSAQPVAPPIAPPIAAPGTEPPPRREAPTPEPLAAAMALGARDPVTARRQLSAMVGDARLSSAERAKAREAATEINRRILFSPAIVPGDPFAKSYVVQSGDSLQKIARSQGLATDWRFLKRVNGLADERKLKAGQTLKLVPGVFNAVVHKADFRMDVFLEQGNERVFVCALPVGLGEHNSTPLGRFKVRPQSRLVNPAWTNPRTGEHYKADDPRNPIGEFWIGIRGIDKANEGAAAYGIHGTTEPESIGREASMGCVRLLAADIALVYELLSEPDSIIEIR